MISKYPMRKTEAKRFSSVDRAKERTATSGIEIKTDTTHVAELGNKIKNAITKNPAKIDFSANKTQSVKNFEPAGARIEQTTSIFRKITSMSNLKRQSVRRQRFVPKKFNSVKQLQAMKTAPRLSE